MLRKKMIGVLLIGISIISLEACDKKQSPQDWPVEHWLDDETPCVALTAKSIIQSGRPYPNEIVGPDHKIIKFDMWVGTKLYEMPGVPRFLGRNGFDRPKSPWKYTSVTGNVENLLGIEEQKFKDPHVGGTLTGNLYCEIGRSSDRWLNVDARSAKTTEDLIEHDKKALESRGKNYVINERSDLNMTELRVLSGGSQDGAIYYPKDSSLGQVIEQEYRVKSIGCTSLHNAEEDLRISSQCKVWIYMDPGVWLVVEVYQQYLPLLPKVHDVIVSTLKLAKRN